MRPALIARADAAFQGSPPKDGGVKRDGPNVVGITCLCGAQVAGPIPLDGTPGQFAFGYWQNFAQAELTFDDGSKHISHGCRNCWMNLRDDTAERFYCRDLIGFCVLEDDLGQEPMPNAMWDRLLTRKVVGVRLVEVG